MRSRYIEIGKVCGVGFVKVVVDFKDRGFGFGDHGFEERTGAELW
jgi:hypothetical protein